MTCPKNRFSFNGRVPLQAGCQSSHERLAQKKLKSPNELQRREKGGVKLALTPESRISLYFSDNDQISELRLEMCRKFAEGLPAVKRGDQCQCLIGLSYK